MHNEDMHNDATQNDIRTAIVTGSTSGIGAAIARVLAADGVRVVVSGRDAARGKALADEIGAAGFVQTDLAGSYDQLREFAAEATALLGGRVDILVNNAGVYPATATADLTDADLDQMLAVNIRAPHGVRVNTVAPGVTLTPGNEAHRPMLDQMTANTPAGTVVHPEDIAKGVRYLVSDDAAMVHGITLYVDGGISAARTA
jgi:NAD(P)-dependent dehydrogenase (short-subunit alcohol dehydrogenase family)